VSRSVRELPPSLRIRSGERKGGRPPRTTQQGKTEPGLPRLEPYLALSLEGGGQATNNGAM
jgi:hypothetical protein